MEESVSRRGVVVEEIPDTAQFPISLLPVLSWSIHRPGAFVDSSWSIGAFTALEHLLERLCSRGKPQIPQDLPEHLQHLK